LAENIALERKEIIDELFDRSIHFIDGFMPFITWLKTTNLKKGVATAMNKHLMTKVERQLNLRDHFQEHIYFIEDVGNRSKPEPDVFLFAAEKLNVDPQNCLVIEDAPHGIEAAKRAGMTNIGIATTFTKEHLKEADFAAADFLEIEAFLTESGLPSKT